MGTGAYDLSINCQHIVQYFNAIVTVLGETETVLSGEYPVKGYPGDNRGRHP